MIVGTMEKKTDSKGKEFFDLTMNIPFMKTQSFYVSKNSDNKTDKSPDYKLFVSGNVAGAMWKKKDKEGNNYLSGSAFCLGMPENRLHFAVFQANDEKQKDEKGDPILFVVISEGNRDGASNHAPDEN